MVLRKWAQVRKSLWPLSSCGLVGLPALTESGKVLWGHDRERHQVSGTGGGLELSLEEMLSQMATGRKSTKGREDKMAKNHLPKQGRLSGSRGVRETGPRKQPGVGLEGSGGALRRTSAHLEGRRRRAWSPRRVTLVFSSDDWQESQESSEISGGHRKGKHKRPRVTGGYVVKIKNTHTKLF